MSFVIRKAERKQAKLRLALTGVSGCGKTLGAIKLAMGMGKRFIIIDTEENSADLYASVTQYDVLELSKPYTPERYIQAIHACEQAGYEIIIIDSLTHAWAGEGGVLDMQTAATESSKSKNSYMAWREVTPWHNKLINTILQSPAHIIATMRSKTTYEVVDDVSGKKRPVKLGLAPIQREGMDYEFTVVLEIDQESHLYRASKDRTQLFEGKPAKITEQTGKDVLDWLMAGKTDEELAKEFEVAKQEMVKAIDMATLKAALNKAVKDFPSNREELISLAQKHKEVLASAEVH